MLKEVLNSEVQKKFIPVFLQKLPLERKKFQILDFYSFLFFPSLPDFGARVLCTILGNCLGHNHSQGSPGTKTSQIEQWMSLPLHFITSYHVRQGLISLKLAPVAGILILNK